MVQRTKFNRKTITRNHYTVLLILFNHRLVVKMSFLLLSTPGAPKNMSCGIHKKFSKENTNIATPIENFP